MALSKIVDGYFGEGNASALHPVSSVMTVSVSRKRDNILPLNNSRESVLDMALKCYGPSAYKFIHHSYGSDTMSQTVVSDDQYIIYAEKQK